MQEFTHPLGFYVLILTLICIIQEIRIWKLEKGVCKVSESIRCIHSTDLPSHIWKSNHEISLLKNRIESLEFDKRVQEGIKEKNK